MKSTDAIPMSETTQLTSSRDENMAGEPLQCSECGRAFLSLRALHSHESLTEVHRISQRLCREAPSECRRNWISGRCELHTDEARDLLRARQRARYAEAGKEIPSPLKTAKRRPALQRLVGSEHP